MPSTTKERLAKLRENRKKDPEKYAEHLRKEKERDAIRRKKKKEELCTEDLKLEQRLKVRDRVRAHRATKKINEKVVCDSPIGSYKCLQTFSKAVRKVKKSLPESPLKKAAVVNKVVSDVLGGDYEIRASDFFKNKGTRITEEAQEVINQFFYRDDASRQAPGMKDLKIVKDHETGIKLKKQKRTMILTIREAYEYFKEINPEIDIGKSSFYNLRPTEVLLIADTPHNVCVCTQHANYINLFKSLQKCLPLPENHKKLMEMISCDITNEGCMSGTCENCPKNFWKLLMTNIKSISKQISWNQWAYISNRPEVITKTTTCEEALKELKNMTDKFRLHCYIKQVQSNHFENTRKNLQKNEAVIQIDFAENYALIHQDEIQSAHKQVTIFTCCIWFHDETKSVAIISNDTSHTKQAVWTFLNNIMSYIQTARSNSIAKFYIFSDNCAAQFKNKYTLSSLHELKDRANAKQLQWNFFAASHGKGAVDGIGGTIKRLAWMGVKSRQVILNSAVDFYNFVKKQTQNIHVEYITTEDIERETQFLKDLWDDVQGIPNLQKQHYFEVLDYRRLLVAKTCKSISVQIAVVLQDIWEEECLQPLSMMTLKKKHDGNQDASSVKSDSDTDLAVDLRAVPGFSGVQTVKKRLKYSDVYTDSEEDEPGSVQKIKPGTFVLVRFQMENKKSTEFRYAGICQSLVSDDDGEVQVMFLKVVGDKATTFRLDKEDVYDVRYEDIICVLPTAILKIKGDRTYYEFPKEIDVFEK